ncbi:MAG: hypothetical protein KDA61_01270 [Planctomycetales bacterium]|nr:hypothetical protein [Planctomycetales bacterium]
MSSSPQLPQTVQELAHGIGDAIRTNRAVKAYLHRRVRRWNSELSDFSRRHSVKFIPNSSDPLELALYHILRELTPPLRSVDLSRTDSTNLELDAALAAAYDNSLRIAGDRIADASTAEAGPYLLMRQEVRCIQPNTIRRLANRLDRITAQVSRAHTRKGPRTTASAQIGMAANQPNAQTARQSPRRKKAGFVGARQLAELEGISAEEFENFYVFLQKKRRNGELAEGTWIENEFYAGRQPRFLFDSDAPQIRQICARYSSSRRK